VFRVFDLASPDAHTPERHFTTVPQQALYLMNSPFAMQAACRTVAVCEQRLAGRESGGDREASERAFIEVLFQRILRRGPTDAEMHAALDFVAQPTTEADLPTDPSRQWRYGVGVLNDRHLVESFKPFPVFIDGRYQGGQEFPHPEWSYASLAAEAGHPGAGNAGSVVRRLTVDRTGTAIVRGFVKHASDKGDGVRVTVAANDKHWAQETVANGRQRIGPVEIPVNSGEIVDLIIDDNGSTSFDSFTAEFTVSLRGIDGQTIQFDSKRDFENVLIDPQEVEPLNRRQQLAQVLMLSNEFIFVD
jgi:hypothetical protein